MFDFLKKLKKDKKSNKEKEIPKPKYESIKADQRKGLKPHERLTKEQLDAIQVESLKMTGFI